MVMTDREILRSYRGAKKPYSQVGVLAQLNAVDRNEIVEILVRQGVPRENIVRSTRSKSPIEPQTMKADCLYCGKEFEYYYTSGKRQIFCSDECAKCVPRNADGKLIIKAKCQCCGTEFEYTWNGRRKKSCSGKCKNKAAYQREKERKALLKVETPAVQAKETH